MKEHQSIFMNVLLVEEDDGTPVVVTTPYLCVDVGDLVEYGCHIGKVVKSTVIDKHDELWDVFAKIVPSYAATAVYKPHYTMEETHGEE